MATAYTTIRLTVEAGLARLRLARTEQRNAITPIMMAELADAFERLGRDSSVRALVLRGSGGWFSAGGDFETMADMPPPPPAGQADPLVAGYRQFGDAMERLNSLPFATIAVVEGAAVGGGFGMACACDIVILSAAARFGIPEPRAGFIPSQILPYLVRRLGEGTVRDLAVTGRVIDAGEAFRRGLGSYLCVDAESVERTLAGVLADIGKQEPDALAAVKRLVLACRSGHDRQVMDEAAATLAGLLRRPQAREGMAAFKARRAPPWVAGLGGSGDDA